MHKQIICKNYIAMLVIHNLRYRSEQYYTLKQWANNNNTAIAMGKSQYVYVTVHQQHAMCKRHRCELIQPLTAKGFAQWVVQLTVMLRNQGRIQQADFVEQSETL